jgi:hypothetical protein
MDGIYLLTSYGKGIRMKRGRRSFERGRLGRSFSNVTRCRERSVRVPVQALTFQFR